MSETITAFIASNSSTIAVAIVSLIVGGAITFVTSKRLIFERKFYEEKAEACAKLKNAAALLDFGYSMNLDSSEGRFKTEISKEEEKEYRDSLSLLKQALKQYAYDSCLIRDKSGLFLSRKLHRFISTIWLYMKFVHPETEKKSLLEATYYQYLFGVLIFKSALDYLLAKEVGNRSLAANYKLCYKRLLYNQGPLMRKASKITGDYHAPRYYSLEKLGWVHNKLPYKLYRFLPSYYHLLPYPKDAISAKHINLSEAPPKKKKSKKK